MMETEPGARDSPAPDLEAPESGAIRARRARAAAEALAEAEARRQARAASSPAAPDPAREINGPAGIEPTVHGDWMVNGRVSDF